MLRRTHDVDYCTAFCRLEDRSECAYWTRHTPQKCGDAKIYDRLHEYEATGLTPEEIIAQRSTLAEYHKDADPLLRAKVEDRLVVLPCRVSATVYDIRRFYNRSRVVRREIVSGQIDHFTIGDAGVPIATVCLHGNEWVDYEPGELMLTQKDAETALKEEEAK